MHQTLDPLLGLIYKRGPINSQSIIKMTRQIQLACAATLLAFSLFGARDVAADVIDSPDSIVIQGGFDGRQETGGAEIFLDNGTVLGGGNSPTGLFAGLAGGGVNSFGQPIEFIRNSVQPFPNQGQELFEIPSASLFIGTYLDFEGSSIVNSPYFDGFVPSFSVEGVITITDSYGGSDSTFFNLEPFKITGTGGSYTLEIGYAVPDTCTTAELLGVSFLGLAFLKARTWWAWPRRK